MSTRLRSRLAAVGVALVTAVAGLVVAAAPAQAASASCTTPYFYRSIRECYTGTIPANSAGSYVGVSWNVCDAYVKWQVIDATNGKVVGSGTITKAKKKGQTIVTGLRGKKYKLRLYNACWRDTAKIFS